MALAAAADPAGSTRLTGRPLWLARLVWMIVLLLAAGKLGLGLPNFYAEKARVCTAAAEICSQTESLSSKQAETLAAAGVSLSTYALTVTGVFIFSLLIWEGVGLLIFLLRSDDWLAMIASAMMILFVTGQLTDPVARAYPYLASFSQLILNLQNVLLFLFFGLFPGGRFAPRWMRWYWLAMCASVLVPARFMSGGPDSVLVLLWVSFLTLGPFSQIYRYRRSSTPVERQQTKWVVFGFAAMAGLLLLIIAWVIAFPADDSLGTIMIQDFAFDLAGIFVPVTIALSILRYRLWDIDVIIRKTLVYALLTGLLAAVYFGSVVLLQSLFESVSGQRSPVVIVLSTLLMAALFAPLRRRVQATIDRRFFRRKVDAQAVLGRFASTARDEVEMERLAAALLGAVEEILQPARSSLWLRPAGSPLAEAAGLRPAAPGHEPD